MVMMTSSLSECVSSLSISVLMDCSNARHLLHKSSHLQKLWAGRAAPAWQRHCNLKILHIPGSWHLVNSFSPLPKWDSAAYLTEKQPNRCDLTGFLTSESRSKREIKPKLIFKSTLKILLNPQQFIFKSFIFSLNYVNLKLKKNKTRAQTTQNILFLCVKMRHFQNDFCFFPQ